jgi:FO synthase
MSRDSSADRAIERAADGLALTAQEAKRLIRLPDDRLPDLMTVASALRNRGSGKRITFSRKVFVPLTTLCRNRCGYCTFRKDPGDPGARTMTPDEVLDVAKAGGRLGCKEALFSLGERPEALFTEQRDFLKRHGHRTTLGYLRAICEMTLKESSLLPHVNPGVMGESDLAALKEVSVSMGLMLESASERLMRPGQPHHMAPDKAPARRLGTIGLAGKLRIPFTTGILIGIGETPEERVESLLAIRDLHERYGHIQEVIVQSFRAKPGIPMSGQPEPSSQDLVRTLAVARCLLGPEMNIQAPPNLSPSDYHALISAGLNDWGGISPLTPDFINPEAPWPEIAELRRRTEAAGYELRERLAIYPEYLSRREFLAEGLGERVAALVGEDGLVEPALEEQSRR